MCNCTSRSKTFSSSSLGLGSQMSNKCPNCGCRAGYNHECHVCSASSGTMADHEVKFGRPAERIKALEQDVSTLTASLVEADVIIRGLRSEVERLDRQRWAWQAQADQVMVERYALRAKLAEYRDLNTNITQPIKSPQPSETAEDSHPSALSAEHHPAQPSAEQGRRCGRFCYCCGHWDDTRERDEWGWCQLCGGARISWSSCSDWTAEGGEE